MPASAPTPVNDPVLAAVADLVHRVTGLPREEVRPERAFVDDLRVDSLAMVEILEAASQHFGVPVEDEAAKHLVHVRDLVAHLSAQLR